LARGRPNPLQPARWRGGPPAGRRRATGRPQARHRVAAAPTDNEPAAPTWSRAHRWGARLRPARPGSGPLSPAQFLDRLRDDLVKIADDAEISECEDGGLRVLVDGDDGAGAAHAGDMLDRPGDPGRQVELRRDGLAGLPDLELVRVVAGVGRRPGGADRPAEQVSELLQQPEPLRAADSSTAGDDLRGLGELRPGPRRLGDRTLAPGH